MRQDVHFFLSSAEWGPVSEAVLIPTKISLGGIDAAGNSATVKSTRHTYTHTQKKTQWSRHVNVQHWPQNGPICTPKNDQKSASRYSKSTPNSSTHSHLLHTLKRRFHQLVNKTSFSPLCIFNVLLRRKMVLYFGSFVSVWPHSTR